MIDTTAIVRNFILSRPGVAAQVVDRVYAVRIPEDLSVEPQIPKFILLSGVGGQASLELPFLEPTIQVKCFGPSPKLAREVYREVFDGLHGIDNYYFSGGYVVFSYEEVQGQDLIDPSTGWAFVLSFFKFRFRR